MCHHPLSVHHAEDIGFAIAVKIAEPQVRDAVAGRVQLLEWCDAAGGQKPGMSVGVKHVSAPVSIEIANCEVAYLPVAFIYLLPFPRDSTPRNHPVAAVLQEDVSASIAIEVAKQYLVSLF